MTFNPLLKEDPHLVVFKKANKHCNPAASLCKPNPQGRACAKSFCRHPSILLPFHHAAQSLHPVSPLREYMRQLRPDYDVISKNIGGVTLPCFYYSAHVICCILYQPVKKHSAPDTRFYHFQPVQWMSKFSPDITWSDIGHIDMQTDEIRFERTHSWIAPLLKMLLLREKILGHSKKGFLLIICKHLSEREGSFSLLLHHASGCYSGLDLLTWIL